MDATQALREVMRQSNLSYRQIAAKLGKYDSYVAQIMSRSAAPRIDSVQAIANACGYRLELVPMDGTGARIVIGDDDATTSAAPTINDARALLARVDSILEQL